MARIGLTAASLVLMAAMLVGCGNPALRRKVEHREANLHRTAALLSGLEDGRTQKMQDTIDLLADQHQRDVANNQQNPGRIMKSMADDLQRWEEVKPVHRQHIAEELEGDPANLDRTLPEIVD
jgi:hypothetical protein